MSKVPIIGIAGSAGSGKDTVASYIAEHYKGVVLAQADPMKRFCAEVFGFTEAQLWGPSENRNQLDPRLNDELQDVKDAFEMFQAQRTPSAKELVGEVFPRDRGRRSDGVRELPPYLLEQWFRGVCAQLSAGKVLAPRYVLQTFGTEFGRKLSKDMWSNYSIKSARALLHGGCRYTRQAGLFSTGDDGYGFSVISDIRFRNEILNIRTQGGVVICLVRDTPQIVNGIKGHASEKELDAIPNNFYDAVLHNDSTLEDLHQGVDRIMKEFFSYPVFGNGKLLWTMSL